MQVNFSRRWSFSDDEEDSSGEDTNEYHLAEPFGPDNKYTYVNEASCQNNSATSSIRAVNGGGLANMWRAWPPI